MYTATTMRLLLCSNEAQWIFMATHPHTAAKPNEAAFPFPLLV
jgi:hypothetical protein